MNNRMIANVNFPFLYKLNFYHYWTTSCLAYCCIFIYFNSVYTLSATSRVVLLFLSLHCSAINTSLSVKLEDLLLYRSNCTSLLLQLNKQPRLTVIYQVMPDWLNRLICLAFMRFLEWLKSFESMAFFGSHLSLWVVLSSFFDNFPFCLYFEEPTTVKQAADDSYWIRHPKCSRIPRPRETRKLYRTNKNKTGDYQAVSWVKGCWLNNKGIHRNILLGLVVQLRVSLH